MTTKYCRQELGALAKIVLASAVVLILAGVLWHGVTVAAFQRIGRDLAHRPGGPTSFRFVLQPLMAVIAAFVDGRKNATLGRARFLWAVLRRPEERSIQLREALRPPRGHFAWLRTRLSVERTMMSWVRTAVSLIGFGVAIVQFFERIKAMPEVRAARLPNLPQYLGISLILCGIMALVISLWQYWWTIRYLWSETYAPMAGVTKERQNSPVVAVAILLLLIGMTALGAVTFRLL